VKGKAGSPYAVKDYYDIDPDLSDQVEQRMPEFEQLVERTHTAGLKLILDFVPNHVAREYDSDVKPDNVLNLGEKDNIRTTYNINNNFYYIPGQPLSPDFPLGEGEEEYVEFPAKATGNDRFDAHPTRSDWYETVKLNYGIDFLCGGTHYFNPIPDTWHKMLDILLFWSSKGVDAFRCDMAEMVPVEFWAWVIPRIKKKFPDITFIAEIYNPGQYRNYLYQGKFDYLYDKVGLYDTLRNVICGKQPASAITGCWQAIEGIQHNMLNFLENHDEQRIASDFFAADTRKAIPAMIVAATMNTNPVMIYFGQELGEKGMDTEGFSGRDGRTSIFDYWTVASIAQWKNRGQWDGKNLTSEQRDLRAFYVSLLQLCNQEKCIREGLFYDLMYVNYNNPSFNPDKQYAYIRQAGRELLLIVVNFEAKDVNIAVFLPSHMFEYIQIDPELLAAGKELLTGEKIMEKPAVNQSFHIELKAISGKIIKFRMK
jgi:glycosidase